MPLPATNGPTSASTDSDLLSLYRTDGSQIAFSFLVERYAGLVYGACRRLLGRNHPLLDDTCQAVFLILAKKAPTMRTPSLIGWLHQTARYASLQVIRDERRRRRREQTAAKNLATAEESESATLAGLDNAIARLSKLQRDVVLRHFLEGKSHAAVAAELGVSENAIKKRTADAIANLRALLSSHGTVTTVGLMATLSAEGSAAPPAALIASCSAHNCSAAAVTLSTGVLKTMFVKTVFALATAAILVAGTGTFAAISLRGAETPTKTPPKRNADHAAPAADPKRVGPLAGLPSKEGPHIAKIKAMPDDSWLNLGMPAADGGWGRAHGRSWCQKMPYAADLRGAFLYGTGPHGGARGKNGKSYYDDDLWVYDIEGNRWVCAYPGTCIEEFTCTLDAHGFEVTKDGEHIPIAQIIHGYAMQTYNSDLKKFMFLSADDVWWCRQEAMVKRRATWNPGKDIANLPYCLSNWGGSYTHPWCYDVGTGKWERHFAGTGPGEGGDTNYNALEYIPSRKQALFLRASYGKAQLWWYDFEKHAWAQAGAQGATPDYSYDYIECFDSKRNRVFYGSISFAYDVAANSWVQSKDSGSPVRPIGTSNFTTMNYDTANDVVVFNSFRPPADPATPFKLGVHVYDPNTGTWRSEVSPLPAGVNYDTVNSFYDPALNVHFFHCSQDGGEEGVMLVYRYRKAKP